MEERLQVLFKETRHLKLHNHTYTHTIRFSFLDFVENTSEDQSSTEDDVDASSGRHGPHKGTTENGRQSPLVNNVHGSSSSSENSPKQLSRKKSEGFLDILTKNPTRKPSTKASLT